MVKRHKIASRISSSKSNKDHLASIDHYFDHELSVLRYINKEIVNIVKEQILAENSKKLKKIHSQMSTDDKKEYARFLRWTSEPSKNKRKFSTTSALLAQFTGQTFGLGGSDYRYGRFLREMSLVYLIIAFEFYLERMLHTAFVIKPQILKSNPDDKISFSDVLAAKDKHSLIHAMASQKTHNLLEKNIDDIAKYLNRTFKIDLAKEKDYKLFKERFYRRNILTHNNLYPDDDYRQKSGYSGKNTRLQITDAYLKRSFSIYRRFGKTITEEMIKKFG